MEIKVKEFGKTKDGKIVHLYSLKNDNGMEVVISDFGACIVNVFVPDKDGKTRDVVLGFKDLEGYFDNSEGFGAFVGRNANRIANAKVTIAGKEYALEANDGPNNLHSGSNKSFYELFDAEYFKEEDTVCVELSKLFPDMGQGFPGNLDVTVTYTLTQDNELLLEYFATCDQDTVINLTNHSYFNLNGHNSGDILGHVLTIDADAFTPTNDALIPTGEIRDVTGTPMDFRKPFKIGDRINDDYEPLKQAGGYDHNYVLNLAEDGVIGKVAEVYAPESGIKMEVFTDLPGMQLYTGNFINHKTGGKDGATYEKRDGVCFESQFFPDACNNPKFRTSIFKAGEEYDYATIFKFGLK